MENSNILFNRYEIIEELSDTAIFNVYLVNDIICDRKVSIYKMKDLFFDNKVFLNSYVKGVNESKHLNHPNTLKFIDFDLTTDYALFLYEGESYKSLQNIMSSNKTFSIAKSSEIINSVLKSLDNAHINRLCHGDLMSDDVLICTDGTVKLRGYGRKDAINSSADAKEILDQFSIFYQSPEIIENKTPSESSDIYSAGTIFYQLLSGKVPFEGSTTLEIGAKILKEIPLNLRLMNKDVSSSLNALILKSISKDISYRPDTASIYLSQISEILKNQRMEHITDNQNDYSSSQVTLKKEVTPQKNATIPLLLTLFALTVFATMLIVYVAGGVGKAIIPDVLGLTEEDARIRLESEGLSLKVGDSIFSDEYVSGTVVYQNPLSGKKAKKGLTITVSLSKGKEFVDMPNVVGMSKSDALDKLHSSGFNIGSITMEYSDTIPSDSVIRTTPESGFSVSQDSNVDVVISRGEKISDPNSYRPLTPREETDSSIISPNGTNNEDELMNSDESSSDTVKRRNKKSSSDSDSDIVIELD